MPPSRPPEGQNGPRPQDPPIGLLRHLHRPSSCIHCRFAGNTISQWFAVARLLSGKLVSRLAQARQCRTRGVRLSVEFCTDGGNICPGFPAQHLNQLGFLGLWVCLSGHEVLLLRFHKTELALLPATARRSGRRSSRARFRCVATTVPLCLPH